VDDGSESVPGEGYGDLQLLGQLLVGLAYVGSDELLSRLRAIGPAVAADVEAYAGTIPDDETMGDVLTYLALGALLRGQRRMARRMRRGLDLSKRAAGWTLDIADRLTHNPLGRPIRESVDRWLWTAMLEGQQAIAEGRRQAQTSRLQAERTVAQIVDDVVEAMIDNPELMAAVQRLARQQSVGLTDTVVSNTRQLTVSADDVAEGVVRRLLRRGPRPALSPVPEISAAGSDGVEDDGTADNA
jgi:hypothetical protein